MIATVHASQLSGTVRAPASKSAMQRACALALLNKGRTRIYHPGKSQDDMAAIGMIKSLGAIVSFHEDHILINSTGQIRPDKTLFAGESGLSLRMFTPIAALSDTELVINGTGSLLQRPMHFFDQILPSLHIRFNSNKGFLPFTIQGPLHPSDIELDGSESSQYLTGLLFAIAATTEKRITLTVNNLVSRPYIDLSLSLMNHFGYAVEHTGYRKFAIFPRVQAGRDIDYTIEGDWSQAAAILVAGAVAGSVVTVTGIDMQSVQADRAILDILKDAGVETQTGEREVTVKGGRELKSFTYDATNSPDLFPALVVLGASCKGETAIKGLSRLKYKESDRTASILDVFGKMGVDMHVAEDSLYIGGSNIFRGGEYSSHHDHRIAMAVTIAGLRAMDDVILQDAEAVNKSYIDFYHDLQSLGARIGIESC